jgi:hypothetical protein
MHKKPHGRTKEIVNGLTLSKGRSATLGDMRIEVVYVREGVVRLRVFRTIRLTDQDRSG